MKTIFADIFQANTVSATSWINVLFMIALAFVVGLFVYWVYKNNYRGVMFSSNFGLTLVLMTTVTAPVVMCIKDSLQLSMGMVGALSIVRFRTAVKDPLDTAYMFWALTMGILIGAGQYILAAITVAAIGALIFLLRRITSKGADSYLLVMRLSQSAESSASQLMRQLKFMKLKSKTITGNGVEVTYEVRVEKTEAFLNKLLSINGVHEASLVAYQSETV
ncbi:MAG: DUF4956 domain-containing protein [Clostridia bacterium]|nr:DUF4956 domain-containing protein [Clostridiales bacterium]MBQ6715620.1 DUF4956 domain-containing protein [Clostridia bacterium]